MTRRLLCLSAGALCLFAMIHMLFCRQSASLAQLDAWITERHADELTEAEERAHQLSDDEDAVFKARAARLVSAREWIAGRRTFAETVEHFSAIQAGLPARLVPSPGCYIAETVDERLCRCVVETVKDLVRENPDRESVLARLESELHDQVARKAANRGQPHGVSGAEGP